MKKLKIELSVLKDKVNKWGYKYYVLDSPEVSDEVYDAAMIKLLDIEKSHPKLITIDSPSQRVGGKIIGSLDKIKHKHKMLSLANAFNYHDLRKFDEDIKKISNLNNVEYFVELKIDGLAVSIVYEEGKMKYAATRGDGFEGENITENITKIFSIPLKVNNKIKNFELRGEVFLSKDEFKRVNKYRKENNDKLFANPRNAAAGSLRVLDSSISKSRKLDAFLYWMSDTQSLNIKTQSDSIKYIASNYAKINNENTLCSNIEEVMTRVKDIIDRRNKFPYEIDGVVIKVNNLSLQKEIGETTKHPKWAIAFKLPTEKAETIVKSIFPTVGRTGKITYNASLEPVRIAGTIVQSATLHNADFINEKDIRVNDFVIINKAGDIIPEVIKVVKEKRHPDTLKWREHTHCPSCEGLLQRKGNDVDQVCVNPECEEKKIQNLIHFASRNALNITGLGEKVIRRFFKLELIKEIKDIYLLKNKKEYITSMDNFGEKSYNNLIENVEIAKKLPLDKLIFALGIKHIGSKTSKIITNKFETIDNIFAIKTLDDILAIHEIGDKIAKSLFNWKSCENNIKLIQFLKDQGQKISIDKVKPKRSTLNNQTFVITGTLSQSREYFQKMIEENGGKTSSSISKKTNYLLVGESAGSKVQKAKELNVQILTEEELRKIIGENNEL